MEWWPFLIFHRGGLRIKVINNTIDVDQITAFVGQNESGKSNLFEALYRVHPFDEQAKYKQNPRDFTKPYLNLRAASRNSMICITCSIVGLHPSF